MRFGCVAQYRSNYLSSPCDTYVRENMTFSVHHSEKGGCKRRTRDKGIVRTAILPQRQADSTLTLSAES